MRGARPIAWFALLGACGGSDAAAPPPPGGGGDASVQGDAGVSVGPNCNDGQKNQGESDVDCGGPCSPCAQGKACARDEDCLTFHCDASACIEPRSCAQIKRRDPNAASGKFTIRPDGVAAPLEVTCDMTADGGGWTQLVQCARADQCKVGNVSVYQADWLAADLGAPNSAATWTLGKSLSSLIKSGQFMVEISDTVAQKTARVLYPLNAETRSFFSAPSTYESNLLNALVLDSDGSETQRGMRVCFDPAAAPLARSYQGQERLRLLGRVSGIPNGNANAVCDYGPFDGQILVRDPGPLSATWGTGAAANWGAQPIEHKIWVRDFTAGGITIAQGATAGDAGAAQGRRWSDGAIGRSCADYRSSNTGARSYAGQIGDGVYSVKPDDQPPMDVQCDMLTDGGGWTLVQRTVWDWAKSQALQTDFATFYGTTVGDLAAAFRARGSAWPWWNVKKEMLAVYRARKSNGQSCAPLYFKATGLPIVVDAANSVFNLASVAQPIPIVDSTELSTTSSGASQNCVQTGSSVPWFYAQCCSTCMTLQSNVWNDAPHPSVGNFIVSSADYFGRRLADVCGADPLATSQNFWGMNAIEIFLR